MEELAARSDVSRAMIERATANPTAVVMDKLANGLGVSLASLFSGMEFPTSFDPLLRHAEQPVWQDPESGYIRRSLPPPSGLENFNATGRSAFSRTCTRHLRHHAMQQPIWIITGQFEIQLGEQTYQLYQGDDLALCVDHPIILAIQMQNLIVKF